MPLSRHFARADRGLLGRFPGRPVPAPGNGPQASADRSFGRSRTAGWERLSPTNASPAPGRRHQRDRDQRDARTDPPSVPLLGHWRVVGGEWVSQRAWTPASPWRLFAGAPRTRTITPNAGLGLLLPARKRIWLVGRWWGRAERGVWGRGGWGAGPRRGRAGTRDVVARAPGARVRPRTAGVRPWSYVKRAWWRLTDWRRPIAIMSAKIALPP
jgi:hypothetical protein